jgi:hypothetical protein
MPLEFVTIDENCEFQTFCPFVAFDTIQKNVRLRIDTRENYEMYTGKKERGGNVKIVALSEIYIVFASVYFVSEG